jgi:GNAT superfamily N-acetyltransferase
VGSSPTRTSTGSPPRSGTAELGAVAGRASAGLRACTDSPRQGRRASSVVGPERDIEDPDRGELHVLNVHPDAWGRGAGRPARRGHDPALEASFAEAVLWVHPGQRAPVAFYERAGWRPDDAARTEVIWGVEVPEVRYRRQLGPDAAVQPDVRRSVRSHGGQRARSGMRSRHGAASSSWAASRSSPASSHGRPTNWTPTGPTSSSWCNGRLMAGWPVRLANGVRPT